MVVVRDSNEGNTVADEIDSGDGVWNDWPRKSDQEPILDDLDDVHGEGGGLTDEEEDGKVESEGAEGVGSEDEEAGVEGGGGMEDGENLMTN